MDILAAIFTILVLLVGWRLGMAVTQPWRNCRRCGVPLTCHHEVLHCLGCQFKELVWLKLKFGYSRDKET